MTVKLCVDCKWCVVRKDATPAYFCNVPIVDPVTGTSETIPDDCSPMRAAGGECGPTGTLWEAKP